MTVQVWRLVEICLCGNNETEISLFVDASKINLDTEHEEGRQSMNHIDVCDPKTIVEHPNTYSSATQ